MYDYVKAFDPHGYSSGEGSRQYSDSQTVDYGFPVTQDAGIVNDVMNLEPIADNRTLMESHAVQFTFGRTPESPVNNFGNVIYPFNNDGDATFQGPKTAKLKRPNIGGKDTKAPRMTAQASGGAASIKFAQDFHTGLTPPIDSSLGAKTSLGLQNEAIIDREFNGQLGPDKQFSASNTPKIAGLGLLALAFFL